MPPRSNNGIRWGLLTFILTMQFTLLLGGYAWNFAARTAILDRLDVIEKSLIRVEIQLGIEVSKNAPETDDG